MVSESDVGAAPLRGAQSGESARPEWPLRALPAAIRGPLLRTLWAAVHQRLCSGRPVTRIRVGPLSGDERAAVADLLGARVLPGVHTTIALDRLDAAVLEATGRDTVGVVGELIGPIADRRQEALSRRASRDELWRWLEGHPVLVGQPVLQDWARRCRRAGLIAGSVDGTRRLLEEALAVLDALPAEGIPLPVFAVGLLGDTHALDDDRRLSALVRTALACLYDVEVPAGAQARRALWEQAGIADDALSVTVLVAGARPRSTGLVPEILRACADAGQAASLTLAQLRACPELILPGHEVRIVENPSILAQALHRLGTTCPPLVCLAGWPNSAGLAVLDLFRDGGQRLHYHGDFDGEGIRIAAHVLAKSTARPWRLHGADYLAAVQRTGPADPGGGTRGSPARCASIGRLSAAPWDRSLSDAMARIGVAVAEEQVLDELLADLEATATTS